MRHCNIQFARLLVTLAIFVSGCSEVQPSRTSPAVPTDISGNWNDTDARIISEKISNELLNGKWFVEHRNTREGFPEIFVGKVRNLTHEHITTGLIRTTIEQILKDSGDVRILGSAINSRPPSGKSPKPGKERKQRSASTTTGKGYVLTGNIYSILDQLITSKTVYYHAVFELHDLRHNRKVWSGTARIKKLVQKSSVKF